MLKVDELSLRYMETLSFAFIKFRKHYQDLRFYQISMEERFAKANSC